MTLGYVAGLRNNQLDEITALVDAGAGAGKLRHYDGSRPATGGAATTLLAENVLSDPSFGAAAAGVLTFNAISDDVSANAAGTGTWMRILDSNDVVVMDGSIGLTSSGEDLELNSVGYTVGLKVEVTAGTITGGNP